MTPTRPESEVPRAETPSRLRTLRLLSVEELEPQEVELLFQIASRLHGPFQRGEAIPLLQGKSLVHLFYENSTRTRLSFEAAARRLGAQLTTFTTGGSSAAKGETLLDTARNLKAMRADAFVIRHSSSGSAKLLHEAVRVPVINAGDGTHEHPTQALLDAYTLWSQWGDLAGKKVVILGDVLHSRVARSNLRLLPRLGVEVSICGPPSLLPDARAFPGIRFATRPEDVLEESDAVMVLRLQRERQSGAFLPSLGEYTRFWGLTRERALLLGPEALILHPGPVNRGVEIAPEVADGPGSVILEQVTRGVLMRMAILVALLNPAAIPTLLQETLHAPKRKRSAPRGKRPRSRKG